MKNNHGKTGIYQSYYKSRQGKEISLIGFGNFSISKVAARSGRNPKTQEPLQIPAYNQPKFKAGQKLKNAVNSK